MDDILDPRSHFGYRLKLVALACLLLAGRRDDRDLKVLTVLAQETFAKGRSRVRMTMRQLVPSARSTVRSVMEALDRLTADGLLIRDREPGATGSSYYSIDVARLLDVAAAQEDFLNSGLFLPYGRAVPAVRKRTRCAR